MCVCVCACVKNRATSTLICVWWNRSNCPLMLVPTLPWQSAFVCVLSVSTSVCEDYVCACAQHGILNLGPNPVILRLSHSVKCSSHSFLNSPHSLVAANVNPDAHKQHLSKWHPIHNTPLHAKTDECNHCHPPTHTHSHAHTDVSGIMPEFKLHFFLLCFIGGCLQGFNMLHSGYFIIVKIIMIIIILQVYNFPTHDHVSVFSTSS